MVKVFDGGFWVAAALEKTMDAINKALHPNGGEAFAFDEPVGAGLKPAPTWINDFKNVTDPTHLFSLLPSEELPKDYSGGVFVPIIGSTGRLGYILLQDKHSERFYDREDMKFLAIIASQAAMCIEAVRHREEAERQDKEAKEERERIQRDIHDGISSEFSGIMAYNEKLKGLLDKWYRLPACDDRQDACPTAIKEMLGNIEASSRRGVRELRNIIRP